MKSTDLKLYDVRTHKRYIDSGLIKDEDYRKFLKSLPDDSENCEEIPFEDPEATMEVSYVPDDHEEITEAIK